MEEPPIVAELVSGPPNYSARTGSGVRVGFGLLGCLGLAVALVVLIAGGVVYSAYRMINVERTRFAATQARQREMLAQADNSPQRAAEIVAAFSADERGVSAAELARIQTLFDTAFAVKDRKASHPTVARLFDLDAYLERLFAWPEMQGFSRLERSAIRTELADSEALNWLVGKLRVAHVAVPPGGQTATVYGYPEFEGGALGSEQRWQLKRAAGGWRICDAELCEQARWRSQMQARHFRYAYRQPAQWSIFNSVCEQIETASQQMAEGNWGAGERQLLAIDLAALDPGLGDELRMRMLNASEVRPAGARLTIARQVETPDEWPQAWLAIAQGEAENRNWAAVIEAGERYIARVGPTPSVCRALLSAHDGRDDDAGRAAMCRHILRVHPEELHTLAALASSGPEETADAIRRASALPEGLDKTVQLLAYLDDDEQPEVSDAVVDHLGKTAADSPQLAEARANLASRRGDSAAAAAILLAAARQPTADAEVRERLADQYFLSMLESEQLPEGIRAWPEPLQALDFAAEDYFFGGDYGATLKNVRQALARAAAAYPDELRVKFYEAKLLVHDEKLAEAEERLVALLPKLPEESAEIFANREEVLSELTRVRLLLGRAEEAYRTQPQDASRPFWWSLSSLDLEQASHRETIRRVLDLHRQTAPQEAWCNMLEAELLEREQESRRAWALVPPLLSESADLPAYRVGTLVGKLLGAGQIPLAEYEQLADRGNVFPQLARQLANQKAWPALKEIIAIEQRSQAVSAEAWRPWLAEVLFQQGELEQLTQQLEPHAGELAAATRYYYYDDVGSGYDRLLRALMRLKRYDRVLELVGSQPAANRDSAWLIWANLAAGRVAEATKVALEPENSSSHLLYQDDDFAPLLWQDDALSVRKQRPPALPLEDYSRRLEVISRNPAPWTDETLAAAAKAALGGDAQIARLTGMEGPAGVVGWRVRAGKQSWLIVAGPRAPDSADEDEEPLPMSADLRQALDDHQSWLTMTPQLPPDEPADLATSYRLLAELATGEPLAARIAQHSRVFAIDESSRAVLRDPARHGELKSLGAEHFSALAPHSTTTWARGPADYWRRWLAFTRRVEQGTALEARVCVRVECCGLHEDLWLSATKLEGQPGRFCTLVVAADAPSQLLPPSAAGELFTVSFAVRDFEEQIDGQMVRGREDE
ncbi:MAG: hypothetical protein SFU86_18040 [Pirellulaceae bacterium]|nr:hypothetical protein [Pirellulaceae bacterium]